MELLDPRAREIGTLETAARDPFLGGAGGDEERLLVLEDSSDEVGWAAAGLGVVRSCSVLGASWEDSSSATSSTGASGEDSSSSSSAPATGASLEDSSLDSSSTVSAGAEASSLFFSVAAPVSVSVSRAGFQKESVRYKETERMSYQVR